MRLLQPETYKKKLGSNSKIIIDCPKQLYITIKPLSINCKTNIVFGNLETVMQYFMTNKHLIIIFFTPTQSWTHLVTHNVDAAPDTSFSIETRVSSVPKHVGSWHRVSTKDARKIENWALLDIDARPRLDLAHCFWTGKLFRKV